jgi:hypothetical protein
MTMIKNYEIIQNKEAKPGDKFKVYKNDEGLWVSVRRLLNFDNNEKDVKKMDR